MSCKTETKQIGEREISVTQWPVEKSMLIKLKLMKTFGPSLAKLLSISNEKSSDVSLDVFSEGISLLFEHNSPEDLLAIIKLCLIGVAVNGRRLTETSINEQFSPEDMMDMYRIFLFVIQVNYQNFFKGQLVEGFLAKLKEKL